MSAPGATTDTLEKLLALGNDALSQGKLDQAVEHYRQAVIGNPGDAGARIALGFGLSEVGRHSEARSHLRRATLLAPQNADAFYLLGRAAMALRDWSEAAENFEEALEVDPQLEIALRDLSRVYIESGRRAEARAVILRGVDMFPASADFSYYLGNLYLEDRKSSAAITCYQKALSIQPEYAEVHNNLGHALLDEGRAEEAIASLETALRINPESLDARDNLLWAMLFRPGVSAAAYLAEAKHYGERALARAVPVTRPDAMLTSRSSAAQERPLRVGMLSGDFRAHAVGFLLDGILREMDPRRIELFAYSMNPYDDALTQRLRSTFASWTSLVGLSDQEAAGRIQAGAVDVLVDLSGHTAHNRLPVFAFKPAPVQVGWLGYLASTGVPGMDYVLADPVAVPAECRAQFTEEIWYLPETFNCFTPPGEDGALAVKPPPVLRNGYVTFGSFQRMNKLSGPALKLWARMLQALPSARLRLQNAQFDDAAASLRVTQFMQTQGIEPDRLVLGGEVAGRENYLAEYALVDIVLDTFPYPGVTTTCEALWMGVPTVTLAGETMLARVGSSLLSCAGLKEWIARSEDEYMQIALKQASDVDGLVRLRAALRDKVRRTVLFDAKRFAPQLENALWEMWRCKTSGRAG